MADIGSIIDSSSDYYNKIYAESMAQRASQTSEKTLGMQDFITLLVAQMQHQDMLNPMDNTEFISQMATFSTLTAMNSMTDQTMTSYAVSLLGKEVVAAEIDIVTGNLVKYEGVVEGISLFEGKPKIYIGGKALDLQSIMSVGKLPEGNDKEEEVDEVDEGEGEGEAGGEDK